jgi:hypothetical protein
MSDLFQGPEWSALAAAVRDDPGSAFAQAVARDWLLERCVEPVADEAVLFRPLSVWDVWSFGLGRGLGLGSGSGRGRGLGSGLGRGRGRGLGSGLGSGSGSGSGLGLGLGSGSGSGSGSEPYKVTHMRVGKAYLVHCGDWHTFVGRVTAQTGPHAYEMGSVSKISETNNGDCWHALAAGDKRLRRAARYEHYTTTAVIPLVIAAFEWLGATPQEEVAK